MLVFTGTSSFACSSPSAIKFDNRNNYTVSQAGAGQFVAFVTAKCALATTANGSAAVLGSLPAPAIAMIIRACAFWSLAHIDAHLSLSSLSKGHSLVNML
jgi:hypothetical protein